MVAAVRSITKQEAVPVEWSNHDLRKEVGMLKKVRLSEHDLNALELCFKDNFLPEDRLWVFGSRADLNQKGGDIDLYIETYAPTGEGAIKMQLAFLADFEDMIGEQKIDVVLNMLNFPYHLPIHAVALMEGVRIV